MAASNLTTSSPGIWPAGLRYGTGWLMLWVDLDRRSGTLRIIQLSNHPGQMQEQLAAARRAGQTKLDRERAAAQRRVDKLRALRRNAFSGGRLLTWVRLCFAVGGAKKQVPVRSIVHSVSSDAEEAAEAGQQGENRVADQLAQALDDGWALYRGYKNARGEIDGVLVGLGGVAAIEVKTYTGIISAHADHWHRQKVDNYGNLREHGPVADGTGRSPSVQLNEVADALEAFLRRQGAPVPVRRVVVFAHPRSQLGAINAITVDAAGTSAKTVLAVLREHAVTLNPDDQARVERLIKRDHAYFERKRGKR